MSQPTRQEIIDSHNALATLVCFGQVQSVGPEEEEWIKIKGKEVAAVLPPKPRPTMAEVEWDDEKHCLAEAEFKGHGPSIMLWETTSERISVINGELVWAARPEDLTPTGKRYTLTEVQE